MKVTMSPARELMILVEPDEVAPLTDALTNGCSACERLSLNNTPTLTGTAADTVAGILEKMRDDLTVARDRWDEAFGERA